MMVLGERSLAYLKSILTADQLREFMRLVREGDQRAPLDSDIEMLFPELTTRLKNILRAEKIVTLRHLANAGASFRTKIGLQRYLFQMGPKSMEELEQALSTVGWTLESLRAVPED